MAQESAAQPALNAEAEKLKNEGNDAFRAKKYIHAKELYSKAIDIDGTQPTYFSNRAFTDIMLENYGSAIIDSTTAISLDSLFAKGYYRRGTAYFALGKFREAKRDFEFLCRMKPNDADSHKKLQECLKEYRRVQFEKAIEADHFKPLSETLDLSHFEVEKHYDGARFDDDTITPAFVDDMLERFRTQKLISRKYGYKILLQVRKVLMELPSLVDYQLPADRSAPHITVCGDTHGQYFDLLRIFELNGRPGPKNPYLFNGDFVDRGSFSCEVIFTLLAFKLLYPGAMHLTRGNHEATTLNKAYGFEGEVKHKYGESMFTLFQEVFRQLPLAYVLNKKVLVVHGGLFSADHVRLDDIRKIDRNREPPESGLMCEVLWSDPQKERGRGPSKRGVGMSFGPDVTKAFLDENGLDLIVRSHEVKEEGYEIEADGRLITVFSAPNYCDQMGNKGAYIHFDETMVPKISQFTAAPHPPIKPMAYSSHASMFA